MDSSASFSGEFGVRYILALAVSATSMGSGCADNCQSVMALGNAILDHSLCGNKYLYP